jgi:lysophospholipase L1-like esterase
MKKRILCFGDSNTWGYVAASGGRRYEEGVRWTSVLAQLLGEEYTVIEEGLNGRASVWEDPVEGRVSGLAYLPPCLHSQAPLDLMILMLGTNDTKPYFSVNAHNIAASVGRLVEIAQQAQAGRDGKLRVLLVAPIHIEEPQFDGIFDERSVQISREFAKTFAATAQALQCDFLDAACYAKPDPADGVHLDANGHRQLAEALYEKVTEIFK